MNAQDIEIKVLVNGIVVACVTTLVHRAKIIIDTLEGQYAGAVIVTTLVSQN